jgi:hypothetical protein
MAQKLTTKVLFRKIIQPGLRNICDDLRQTVHYLLLILLISSALFFLLIGLTRSNSYGIYPPPRLLWGIIVIPLFYVLTAILLNRLFLPKLRILPKQSRLNLALLSLLVAAVFAWIFPTPLPAISKQHTIQIISTGVNGSTLPPSTSQGAVIEIYQMRFVNGALVPLDEFKLSGDWQIRKEKLVSDGTITPSVAELSGVLPDGIVLWLRFNNHAGKAIVSLDNQSAPLDLFSKQELSGSIPFTSSPWQGASAWEIVLLLFCSILFYLGVYFIVYSVLFIFEFHLIKSKLAVTLILLLMYGAVLGVYFQVKSSYHWFNGERIFNDTPSYIQTAQSSINSLEFWAGERTFTLPLLYKLNGLNLKNFYLTDNLKRIGDVQTWISMASWIALGLALAANMRRKWLGPLAFGLVLFFSLSLEISLWDRLMLSESISFSMFALLVAAWMFLELMPGRWLRKSTSGRMSTSGQMSISGTHLVGYIYLVVLCLISVLFSFARDSNIYFLAISAGFFALMLLVRRTRPETRKYYLIYVIFIAALFFAQNISFQRGDRWVPHVYDNLASRIVADPQGLAYFKAAGMPVNEKLLKTPYQTHPEINIVFGEDPDMQPLRDWVMLKGQSTYFRYIITHPAVSILAPIRNFKKILNGGNLEYRWPRYPYQPVPPRISSLDNNMYPRQWWELAIILGLVLAGGWLHLIQLGVQFRLAGWMALILLVDRLLVSFSQIGSTLPHLTRQYDNAK